MWWRLGKSGQDGETVECENDEKFENLIFCSLCLHGFSECNQMYLLQRLNFSVSHCSRFFDFLRNISSKFKTEWSEIMMDVIPPSLHILKQHFFYPCNTRNLQILSLSCCLLLLTPFIIWKTLKVSSNIYSGRNYSRKRSLKPVSIAQQWNPTGFSSQSLAWM